MTRKAIIIGASSGIGRELSKILARDGYTVGLAARRVELLEELQSHLPSASFIKRIDITHHVEAMNLLDELIQEMGGVDLLVICSGTGHVNPDLEWEKERDTIDTNVGGFVAMAGTGMKHFLKAKKGCLVGISSIAALRGNNDAPSYNASKAFISNYMEGLRRRVKKLHLPITITDIKPGYVDTPMASGSKIFWMSSTRKAAMQIYRAIQKKKRHAYITRRWRLVAWAMKCMPSCLYERL